MNSTRKTCTDCGAELADDAVRGLCPRCLLQAGLGSQTDPDATVSAAGGSQRRRTLPEIGGQCGPYRIVRLLGRGGMGVVYEAEEQETSRRVALKVLGRQFDSPSDRARFLREGRLAASINHPNSVYVYGTEEIDGTPTIAMELVAGGTLQERVKKQGPMPVPVAVDAMLQIITGLEAAQAIGILHRDIKPGNCFEDTDGTIKIGDFGLSISTSARAETNITAEGAMVGTPAFCSPEQLRADDLNVRSDMYSVGATLFYLLTGRVPFEGHNLAQLTASVIEKPAPSPRDLRKEIPKGLARIIQRCLAKQPADRFRSYAELRESLVSYGSTAATPATLSLRFVAGVLDQFTLGLVNTLIVLVWFGTPWGWLNATYELSPEALAFLLAGLVASVLYYAILEGCWGATLGKAICRLRVVRPDKSPPGFLRALLRAVLYVVLPALPFWIIYGGDPKSFFRSSFVVQQLMGFSSYVVLALLFSTARRRNGYASVHDLVTSTRVISRAALQARPALATSETPPPAVETQPTVGPYHILETLQSSAAGQWLLGYDLRLLRKVWIRTVAPGTPPLPAPWTHIGRVGRLRWLAGRRSSEENWDVFEGVSGTPFLHLVASRQPWSRVRFWLDDLAKEINAAEKDGTLPAVLTLDRIWITGEGRAKLLDFPAPGLASEQADRDLHPEKPQGAAAQESPGSRGISSAELPLADTGRTQRFLAQVAVSALEGRIDTAATPAAEPAVPMPLEARNFLRRLPELSGAAAAADALQPLLRRLATVSQLRRAAVVAGCGVFPVLMSGFMIFGMAAIQKTQPDIMELSLLLKLRQAKSPAMESRGGAKAAARDEKTVTDRQLAIFIASHYRAAIADPDSWNSSLSLSLIRGDERRFAERSVAEHPEPTSEEIADAEAAVTPWLSNLEVHRLRPFSIMTALLMVYVSIPALITALLFRGGLLLRMAGITFVRRDGKPASRLRVFWRGLVAWSPLWLGLLGIVLISSLVAAKTLGEWPFALINGVALALAILSMVLPERGLPDLFAGTWPVPR